MINSRDRAGIGSGFRSRPERSSGCPDLVRGHSARAGTPEPSRDPRQSTHLDLDRLLERPDRRAYLLERPDRRADTPEHAAHRLRNGVIGTAALGLALLGIALAVPDLREALSRIGDVSPWWLVLAFALEVGSCLGYVAVVRLVLHRAPARETRWLAWSEMAFGAVVPVGGAGGLAVGAWALRGWGISWSRIANRSAVIFLLTSAVNVGVLALAGFGVWAGIATHRAGLVYGLVPGAVALSALVAFCLLPFAPIARIRARRPRRVLRTLARWVQDTEALAMSRDPRLLGAAAYLLLDIAMLWVCLRAVGVSAPPLALVVGYQVGYLANMIPIPGGVGVLEGGLLGALLLYGLPASQAAAGIVLYHVVALWVPVFGGTVGFARLQRSVTRRPPRLSDRQDGPRSTAPAAAATGPAAPAPPAA